MRSLGLVAVGAALAAGVVVAVWQPWQEHEPTNTLRSASQTETITIPTLIDTPGPTPRVCAAYELFKSAQSEFLEDELLTDAVVCVATLPARERCSALLELLDTADSRSAETFIYTTAESRAWGCLGPPQPETRNLTELSEAEMLDMIDGLYSSCVEGINDAVACEDIARLPLEQQWCPANPTAELCQDQ